MTENHVVVVDDELDIRNTLREYLELQGFRVSTADAGEALRRIVAEQSIDLVVLDVRMPGEDGISLARFLREATDAAIIMLTSAGKLVDRVVGLESGADDYLAKPVDPRELLARVKAVLRRYESAPSRDAENGSGADFISLGPCRLNLDAHTLLGDDGKEIPITSLDFELLRVFAERPNRILSRDQLFLFLYDREWEPPDRSIDIRISRLRRKIERDPNTPQIIKTVHGAGYVYAAMPSPC